MASLRLVVFANVPVYIYCLFFLYITFAFVIYDCCYIEITLKFFVAVVSEKTVATYNYLFL